MPDSTDSREGGCQCGRVRYRLEGSPIALAICHCSECQRQSGSAFGMSLIVPEASFQLVVGKPQSFTRDADSGSTVTCYFCGSCGTRLYHDPESRPGSVNIKAGTLDDTSWLAPNLHVWTRSKQPWVPIPEGVPCFERQP
jgi:hypothetical protein